MKQLIPLFGCLLGLICLSQAQAPVPNVQGPSSGPKKVYVVPVQGDIDASIIYIIRRGVKEAMEAGADVVILDMDTYGGRVDITEDIFKVLNRFPHQDQLYTYVNTRAGSAGSIISSASHQIYMAPGSVIGAAAVVNGDGKDLSETMNLKMTSFIKGITRAQAERQGLRPEVFEAMIDSSLGLEIDGKVIAPKGSLLSLTSQEAAVAYNKPPRPLLSSGTIASLDKLVEQTAGPDAIVTKIEPTGFEAVGSFIVMLSPVFLGVALFFG
jgi:membrane-bound serine protease (ClpP class)